VSRIYVAPISTGLGDLVVSLPAIQGLMTDRRKLRDEIWLVARSAGQAALAERIDGLAGTVDEAAFDPAATGGRFINLRDHPLQRDHWWGLPEFDAACGPLSINDIVGQICVDFGIPADFSRPIPLQASRRAEAADLVLLITESDGPTKQWPVDRWAAVAAWARESGIEARGVVRARGSAQLGGAGIGGIVASTPGAAVDLLSSCRAAVGIDTGLTHIAVQQGTPTVMLSRDRPVYFRPWPHSRAVVGTACVEECNALERTRACNAHTLLAGLCSPARTCPTGVPCMGAITPTRVVAALEELL
jgi:Glycosyltransferase family 9 (heptosyltransferase)